MSVHPSKSGGEPHTVTHANGKWSCSCKAGANGKECWAIKKEKGMDKLRKRETR